MNERIKQFANIWANCRAEDEKLGIVYTFSEPALEKFAELLVWECMQIAKDHTTGPYEMGMSKKTHTAWNIYMDMANRFGINNE